MAENDNVKTSFFIGLKSEFKKIVWPTQETLIKQTIAVIAASIALGLITVALDWVFQLGFSAIIK